MIFSPDKQIAYTRDERRCYFGTAPTIATVNQTYGCKASQEWLVYQLADLSEFSGVKGKITGNQIKQLSEIIADDYPYLKISEIMLFFRQLKDGKFGMSFYGSVDPMTIMNALHKFVRQRGEAYYNHERNNDKVYDEYFRIMAKQKSQQDYMNEMMQTTFTTTDKD